MGASAEKVVRQKWCLLQATMDEREEFHGEWNYVIRSRMEQR